MGRVYAVVSAKGGVGKTTTTTNLAAALAAAGADVAVVDGDLGMANLAGSLGVDSSGATLHDVLAEEAELGDAVREGPHGMAVVPGSPDLDAFARADPEGLRGVLGELASEFDYVLLDTGAGLSNDTVVPLTYVDEALLVSTTARGSLGDTEKTRQVAERLDVPVAGVVLTRVDPDKPNDDDVASTLQTTVLSSIPRTDVVRDAGDAGEPLTTYAPGSDAATAYRELAADLTGESIPATRSATADDVDESADDVEDATDDAEDATDDAEEGTEDETDADDDTDADAEDEPLVADADEDIIVAGRHDEDGASEDADAGVSDDPLADPVTEVGVTETTTADADGEEPAGGDEHAPEDDRTVEASDPDPTAESDSDSDDEPLIETAEAVEDADEDETADVSEAEDDEDEEEGVYTTSLAGGDEEEEKEEKKGLFGRFLG
ncbi:cell division ATPase MinD [Halogeometricum limi]|uniref:Septum site-determining protein MinD n=1 Tax=Halogeometricum limi TaxID=555875 RepID=A0A1I6FXD2_9EURY|nr:cell division ATPase MinD [Halogeometricum limi]SFR34576.1 septum site-determining protein MinD [Halogeometricum limi]